MSITLVRYIFLMWLQNTDIGWNRLLLWCYTLMLLCYICHLPVHTCSLWCYITVLHFMSVLIFRQEGGLQWQYYYAALFSEGLIVVFWRRLFHPPPLLPPSIKFSPNFLYHIFDSEIFPKYKILKIFYIAFLTLKFFHMYKIFSNFLVSHFHLINFFP